MDIFKLPEGHNERDIKRAYAKALKTIDVDKNPEQFQQLHQAYKQALFDFEKDQLNELEGQTKQSIPNSVDSDSLNAVLAMDHKLAEGTAWEMDESNNEQWLDHDSLTNTPPNESFDQSETTTETSDNAVQTQQLAKLEEQLEQLLAQPNQCIKLQAWLFLNEFPELTDYDFWLEASQIVYDKIAFSQSPDYKGKKPDLSREVLAFIDSIFNWFEYLADPEEPAYNHHQCLYNRVQELHGILPPSTEIRTDNSKTDGFQIPLPGICALALDISIVISLIEVLKSLTSQNALNSLFSGIYIPLLGLVYYLTFLSSPLQGTPGQFINNIRVTRYDGQALSFLDCLRRSSILIIITAFTIYTNWIYLDFYSGPISWSIMFIPMITIGSWYYLKNTKLTERIEKNGIFEKDVLSTSIFATAIDWVLILLLMVGIQEVFAYPAILALEGKHGFTLHLFYYVICLSSPLNGTLGHLFLKVKVVNRDTQKPNVKEVIERSSGLICWTACSHLSLLMTAEQQDLFKGQLNILISILCFFIWKHFNQSHLASRQLKL